MTRTAAVAAETNWLEEARSQARRAFETAADPEKSVETWRRVNFGAWRLNQLSPAPSAAAERRPARGASQEALKESAGVFRQTGNQPAPFVALDPELARRGVVFCSLEEAAVRHADRVAPYFKAMEASQDFRKLEAANLARFRGGAFLYIPKGLAVDKPFDISFSIGREDAFYFPRVLVLAEGQSRATVVEEYADLPEEAAAQSGGRPSCVAFSHASLGPGASLRYFYRQAASENGAHFWRQSARLDRDSLLHHYSVLMGGAVHKSQLDVLLTQPGAVSELYGIVFGNKEQVFDPHTSQDHRAPRTKSDLLYRTALQGRARSIYTGLIRIEKDAKGTEAYQQNNNVLLSNAARADSTPVLEILTDDVHCKHGATVGPVNPDELFYLQSRGLSNDEAVKMLLMGYFNPVLAQLPSARLQDEVPAALETRIGS